MHASKQRERGLSRVCLTNLARHFDRFSIVSSNLAELHRDYSLHTSQPIATSSNNPDSRDPTLRARFAKQERFEETTKNYFRKSTKYVFSSSGSRAWIGKKSVLFLFFRSRNFITGCIAKKQQVPSSRKTLSRSRDLLDFLPPNQFRNSPPSLPASSLPDVPFFPFFFSFDI